MKVFLTITALVSSIYYYAISLASSVKLSYHFSVFCYHLSTGFQLG